MCSSELIDMLDILQYASIAFVVIVVIGIFVILHSVTRRHGDFIKKAEAIKNGMTFNEVISIMGCSATTTENDGDRAILIWEKSQWKGIVNGGTVTRAVKVVFVDDHVTSTLTKNLNQSTFF